MPLHGQSHLRHFVWWGFGGNSVQHIIAAASQIAPSFLFLTPVPLVFFGALDRDSSVKFSKILLSIQPLSTNHQPTCRVQCKSRLPSADSLPLESSIYFLRDHTH